MHVLVADRHRLVLVFENFDAQAVRRLDIGLIEPAVAAGQHRNAIGLPLGDLLLDVVDDEADVVDHRPCEPPLPAAFPSVKLITTPGNLTDSASALDQFAAHAEKDLLVGFRVFEARCQ